MGFLDHFTHFEASQNFGHFLTVAPLSLVNHWNSEAATWAPDMVYIIYYGSADARNFLVQQEFFYKDQFMPKVSA